MFLDKVKDFLIKKSVKKRLLNVKLLNANTYIKTVGIIIDEQYFNQKEKIVNLLVENGLPVNQIKFIVFKNQIKKTETFDYPVFSYKNINWSSHFEKNEISNFISYPFDLLINYYDQEKAPLILATNDSKASFKVGFSSVDNRLNHFMIDLNPENSKIFIDELFKYLKILNKI